MHRRRWSRFHHPLLRATGEDLYALFEALLGKKNPYPGESPDDVIWRKMICDRKNEKLIEDHAKMVWELFDWDQVSLSEEIQLLDWACGHSPRTEKVRREYEIRLMRNATQYAHDYLSMMRWKRFAASLHGYLVAVPIYSSPSGELYVIMGVVVPFMLRAMDGGYHLIGERYGHGFMHGEALDRRDVKVATLNIV